MFEPKSGKVTPPVLRKFRGQQQINSSGGESTAKSNPPEEKTTPSWVKKPVVNGTVPPKPEVTPKSPVSTKPPPTIPKKAVGVTHKWSPDKSTVSSTADKSKETPAQNTFRKLSTDTSKPVSPVLKDINHNVKTQPFKSSSDITTGNKRASVADIQKSFQSDSNSSSSNARVTSVTKPPKENTSPVETKQSEEVVRRTSNVSTVSESKSSISDRIASLQESSGEKKILFNRKSMVTRKRDSKQFHRFTISKNDKSFDGPPPSKPPKLTDIDLEPIKVEFKQLQSRLGNGEEDEELYDDIGNVMPQFSVIQPMTEEEEYADVGNVMAEDDMDTYDDCTTAPAETDEVYEPIDEDLFISGGSVASSKTKEQDSEDDKKKREEKEKKELDKKAKKELKKEQDRKIKEEKERQNELKKKEKENAKLFKSLKITGSEPKQGEGVLKEDSKGNKLNLAVKKGERVDIIRMDDNPSGKWLVKTMDARWGYVESSNVEVATSTIRQWMNDDQEYMNPDDIQVNGIIDDEVYEEI